VIETHGKLIPIEVKLGTKQNKGMVLSLINFTELFSNDIEQGYLVNMADQPIILSDKIRSLPYKKFIQHPIGG
jgi:hypothetical protein